MSPASIDRSKGWAAMKEERYIIDQNDSKCALTQGKKYQKESKSPIRTLTPNLIQSLCFYAMCGIGEAFPTASRSAQLLDSFFNCSNRKSLRYLIVGTCCCAYSTNSTTASLCALLGFSLGLSTSSENKDEEPQEGQARHSNYFKWPP